MLTAILVGATTLIALTVGSAALIYAHLTGRVRKPVMVGAIVISILLGAVLLGGCVADGEIFRRLTFPIGVFFLLAGVVSGLVMLCQGPGRTVGHPAARRVRRAPPDHRHQGYAA